MRLSGASNIVTGIKCVTSVIKYVLWEAFIKIFGNSMYLRFACSSPVLLLPMFFELPVEQFLLQIEEYL